MMKGHEIDAFFKLFSSAHPSDSVMLKTGRECIIEWVDIKRKSCLVFNWEGDCFQELSLSSVLTFGSHSAPNVDGSLHLFVFLFDYHHLREPFSAFQ